MGRYVGRGDGYEVHVKPAKAEEIAGMAIAKEGGGS
jgi:hypothetical protein